MAPSHQTAAGPTRRPDPMVADLCDLLAEARTEATTPSDFRARLDEIHTRHLGRDASAGDQVERRRRASKAYDGLRRESPSRHHQFELLAEALGLEAEPALSRR